MKEFEVETPDVGGGINLTPLDTPKSSTHDHTRFDDPPLIVIVIVSAPDAAAVVAHMNAFWLTKAPVPVTDVICEKEFPSVSVTELTVLDVSVVAMETTIRSPDATPLAKTHCTDVCRVLCPPTPCEIPSDKTLRLTAVEMTVTGVPALSVTCNSNDQVPTVFKAPVEVDTGDVQEKEPPKLLKVPAPVAFSSH